MASELSITALLVSVPPGSASRQRVRWNPEAWLARPGLEPWRSVLEDLARRGDVSRADVRAYANHDPCELLVASMVWGFGPLGYGAARTAEMLAGSRTGEPVGEVLEAIRREVRRSPENGFTAVFANLQPKLGQLGTSYATKFLHFAEAGFGAQRALVYDARVSATLQALSEYPGSAPDPRGRVWSSDYAAWCAWAEEQAQQHGCAPEDIEFAAFVANGAQPEMSSDAG